MIKEVKLDELLTFQRGFDITKKEQIGGDVPVISSGGISSFHNEHKVNGPGVVIGRKGTLGTVFYTNKDYWPHDTTLWVKDFKGNDPKFIYYLLQVLHFERFDAGAANPTLNRNHLHALKLMAPKERYRTKIASILSAYDDLIENNNQRIQLLEEMAEEIYKEWFVRLRFPATAGSPGYQEATFLDKEGNRVPHGTPGALPEGWERKRLGTILNRVESGRRPKGGAESKGIPSIGAENVIGLGKYQFNKEKFVSLEFFKKMRNGIISSKDVLLYKDGADIGRVTMFQDEFPHKKCCINEHVFIIHAQDTELQNYIYMWLATPMMKKYIENINTNAAQPGINKRDVEGLPFVLPSKWITNSYYNISEPMIGEIFNLAKKNQLLKETRDLLLPRLISGKLNLENLNWEEPESLSTPVETQESYTPS